MTSEQVIDAVEKWRWVILSITAIVCVCFLYQLTRLTLNPTPYFIDRLHASRIADHQVKDRFTSTGETAIVVVKSSQGSIYNSDYLERINRLTSELSSISLITEKQVQQLEAIGSTCCASLVNAILANGLDRNDNNQLATLAEAVAKHDANLRAVVDNIRVRLLPILRVRSLTTLETLTGEEESLDVSPLVSAPYSAHQLDKLAREVSNNPQLKGLFVSHDESASAILVELRIPEDDSLTMIDMHDALMSIARSHAEPDTIYLGGPPMVTAQTSQVIQHDNFLLTPIVTLIMGCILWWSYRRVEAVLIPLTVAGVTTLIALGSMAALNIPLNIVTTVLPVFLISMIIADSVHVLNRYFINLQSLGHHKALRLSFRELWYPMVFYSVTTMIGFIAMMNTDLVFLKQLGQFVLLGLAVGLLLNLILLPTLLSAYRSVGADNLEDNRFILWVGQRSEQLARSAINHRLKVMCGLVFVALAALGAASHIKSHNEVIGYFDDDTAIKQHEHAIRDLFGGTTPFSVWMTSENPERFRDPDVITALGSLQQRIDALDNVGYVTGLSDYVNNAYRVISNGLPDTLSRDSIAQHLFFYENARDRDIRDVVDLDYNTSRMFVVAGTDHTQRLDSLLSTIQQNAQSLLPPDIEIKITGFAEILVTSADEIIGDQTTNVTLALLLIWLAMLALYRSAVLATIAITPLTLSILLNLSLMSVLDIPLNIGTALIATVTFGVGIDYAIHIMNNIRNTLKDNVALPDAIYGAVKSLASGICINSLAVGLGCFVLVASQYEALQNLGILVASGMIICAVVTLISLPVLAYIAEPAWRKYRAPTLASST